MSASGTTTAPEGLCFKCSEAPACKATCSRWGPACRSCLSHGRSEKFQQKTSSCEVLVCDFKMAFSPCHWFYTERHFCTRFAQLCWPLPGLKKKDGSSCARVTWHRLVRILFLGCLCLLHRFDFPNTAVIGKGISVPPQSESVGKTLLPWVCLVLVF